MYLVYGDPTERIDKPVEATIGPYVIWTYSNAGETFAFGDFRKDGNYELIYSTDERFPGDPAIQTLVETDNVANASQAMVRPSRGYDIIVEDIRLHRTGRGYQQ